MRHRPKIDANHGAIVKALRNVGASVQSLAAVGGGCLDILVGHAGRNLVLEIKDGAKPPSARELTPKQREWCASWRGEFAVVSSVEEALAVVGVEVAKLA